MSNFNLNIYTPNGVVVEGLSIDEASIPTATGIINVLKGHTHLISEIGTGILEARAGGSKQSFTLAGGLCKVLGNDITIVAKSAESSDSIDVERAKAAQTKAGEKLASGEVSTEVLKYQRKIARAKNRIKIFGIK
jgi:F-type H+-transporting ATPase subunit epsilon